MEPSPMNSSHSAELPAPVEQTSPLPEQVAAQPEVSGNQPAPTPMPTNPPAASSLPTTPLPPHPDTPSAAPVAPSDDLIADDSDLIEKEWVMKAKAIVAQTKDDPYAQNQSMSKVKADYLKKRYNKDLKLSES